MTTTPNRPPAHSHPDRWPETRPVAGCYACADAAGGLTDRLAEQAAGDGVPLLRVAPELHLADRVVFVRALALPRERPPTSSLTYHHDFAGLGVADMVRLKHGDVVLCNDGTVREVSDGPWRVLSQYDSEPYVSVAEGATWAGAMFRRTSAAGLGAELGPCPVSQGESRCVLEAGHWERSRTPHQFPNGPEAAPEVLHLPSPHDRDAALCDPAVDRPILVGTPDYNAAHVSCPACKKLTASKPPPSCGAVGPSFRLPWETTAPVQLCAHPVGHAGSHRSAHGAEWVPREIRAGDTPEPLTGRSVDELASIDVRGRREVTIATRDLAAVYLEPADCGADGCERGYVSPTNDVADRFPCARCGGRGAAVNHDEVSPSADQPFLGHLWSDPVDALATCTACGTFHGHGLIKFFERCPVRSEAAERDAARPVLGVDPIHVGGNARCTPRALDEVWSPQDVVAALADYRARRGEVCGHRNPDYDDLACTYPAGHGLVPPEGDETHDGHDHGDPESGAWWSETAAPVPPAALTADAHLLRDADGQPVAFATERSWATVIAEAMTARAQLAGLEAQRDRWRDEAGRLTLQLRRATEGKA